MSSDYCKTTLSNQIKAEALRLGFSACGIARAERVPEETSKQVTTWLSAGKHAGMSYMANYLDKRIDPQLLVEGTRSIVSVALNYYPKEFLKEDQYQFAWYAYGKDYHDLMRSKLNQLFTYINESLTPVKGRTFCDTAPVLERHWAWKAGIGWIGKNSQLIIPHAGSCFFLGEIFLDIELVYDTPLPSRCGTCTRCIDNCPTEALSASGGLDANRCLSYLTIENRGEIPEEFARSMGNRVYGCDECQKACPWNRFATPCNEQELQPHEAFITMTKEKLREITAEEFKLIFKGSAVKRAKYEGLKRNITV